MMINFFTQYFKSQIVNLKFLQFILFITFIGCLPQQKEKPFPIYGERDVVAGDTIYHTIAAFEFLNQDSQLVNNTTVKDKIYVTDFFFTSCRTICPKMKTQMLRVYENIQDLDDVLILSHTIDPEYDTVGLLKDYAARLGVSSDKWHFLTGNKDDIYKIAQTSYFVTAFEDKTEPDGFVHSGAFLLIDKQGRIRAKYDGTVEADVNRLMKDIRKLQKEYE
jgi:protein SCO1